MKSAQELASAFLTTPEEQKRQALALRRLAGGVRAAAGRKDSTGLSDEEVRALLDAAAVLIALAENHTKAQKLTQQKRAAREVAERSVRASMLDNFDTLKTISERIALIAAVRSYLLRDRMVLTLDDLHYHFKECIDSLSYDLTTKVLEGRAPRDVIAEAWARFDAARPELQDRHAQDIGRLTVADERTQQRRAE